MRRFARFVEQQGKLRRSDVVHLRPYRAAHPGHLPQVLWRRASLFVLGTFYTAMVAAGLIIELAFGLL
jgi:hypothetical protein